MASCTERHLGDDPVTSPNHVTHYPRPQQQPRFSFCQPVAPSKILEVCVEWKVTSVKVELCPYNGKETVYVTTNRVPTVTRYTLNGDVIAQFGEGHGGLALDTHPGRDCVCLTHGSDVIRTYRDGSRIEMGYPPVLEVKGAKNMTSMTCINKHKGKGHLDMKVTYVTVDADLGCVLLIKASKGKVMRKVPAPDVEQFIPCCVAYNPTIAGGVLVMTGYHSNQVRLYSLAGKLLDTIAQDLNKPFGVCVDGTGRIIVCNHGSRCVVRFRMGARVNWEVETLITPEVLDNRRPCHVDVSPNGHMILSVQSEHGDTFYWQLYQS